MKTASSDRAVRQLTVRLPGALLVRARAVAKARGQSVSKLVRRALEDLDRATREEELKRAYALLGEDGADDVEAAFEGQAEVARRG